MTESLATIGPGGVNYAGPWGVYDTKDNVWLGDKQGPVLYVDQEVNGKLLTGYELARVSAEMCDIRLHQTPGRSIAKLYTEKAVRKRDEVQAHCTVEEALDKKERGLVL